MNPPAASPKIAALIPIYCEAALIADVVRRTRVHADLVLVVDDGSPDESAAIARRAGAEVLVHGVNRGKGAAIKTGAEVLCARGAKFILLLDGDGQHAPEEIARFVTAAENTGADIVVGNRFDNAKGMPFVRRLVNRLMSALISRACGVEIPDTQCGFRLVRASAIPVIMGRSDRFDFETEMLLLASRAGLKIRHVPVSTIYGDETSKIRPWQDSVRFCRLMLRAAGKGVLYPERRSSIGCREGEGV
jgi:glycosyltransferase involved in cell wall biosynthesis